MTRPFSLHTTYLFLLCAGMTLQSHAESFTSSALSAGSASSASISDSIKGSSRSSNHDKMVAEGQYRVMAVEEAPGQPTMTRLTLRATEEGPAREFFLDLPRQALGERPLATGDQVQARQRPYGFEFARLDTRKAFFLVLTDDWHHELDSHVVAL